MASSSTPTSSPTNGLNFEHPVLKSLRKSFEQRLDTLNATTENGFKHVENKFPPIYKELDFNLGQINQLWTGLSCAAKRRSVEKLKKRVAKLEETVEKQAKEINQLKQQKIG